MSQQEQRLLGQAANNLQQRDAALIALHRVEDEVLHLKALITVRPASGRKEEKQKNACVEAWLNQLHQYERCSTSSSAIINKQHTRCMLDAY